MVWCPGTCNFIINLILNHFELHVSLQVTLYCYDKWNIKPYWGTWTLVTVNCYDKFNKITLNNLDIKVYKWFCTDKFKCNDTHYASTCTMYMCLLACCVCTFLQYCNQWINTLGIYKHIVGVQVINKPYILMNRFHRHFAKVQVLVMKNVHVIDLLYAYRGCNIVLAPVSIHVHVLFCSLLQHVHLQLHR